MNKEFHGVASMPHAERSDIVVDNAVPGPGTYDTKHLEGLPKWTLQKRLDHGSCFQHTSITPGPGRYDIPNQPLASIQKTQGIRPERYRHYLEKGCSQSALTLPGAINPKTGFSFGYRQAPQAPVLSPGPIYHTSINEEIRRAHKNQYFKKGFGMAHKDTLNRPNSQPGPGSYSPTHSRPGLQACFSTSRRPNQFNGSALGPGQYDPKTSACPGRSFQLRGRSQPALVADNSTGPGSYDVPCPRDRQAPSFGVKMKVKVKQEQVELSPCSYDPPRYLDRPEGQGCSLAQRLEPKATRGCEEPGPGSYEVAGKTAQHGGYMGRKVQGTESCSLGMENFYKYEPKSSRGEGPKFSFPQGKRGSREGGNPNDYSHQFYQTIESKSNGFSYTMSTSKRFADAKKQSGPFRDSSNYSTIGRLPHYLAP